jgi:hypothetical protein
MSHKADLLNTALVTVSGHPSWSYQISQNSSPLPVATGTAYSNQSEVFSFWLVARAVGKTLPRAVLCGACGNPELMLVLNRALAQV